VELTDTGRKALDQAVDADITREKELVAGLNAAERRSLATLLKKLLSRLEPTGDRPGT